LSVVKLAVLSYGSHAFATLTTCACVVRPAPSVVSLYTSDCSGGSPAIDQPGSVFSASIDQLSPPGDGSRSVTVRPVAVPVP
jgi:hypothetical protein